MNRVVVNVPATTANLGPGFDSFGFALDVWNRVTVERADKFSMTVLGEGEDTIDRSEKNIVVKMCKLALKTLGQEMPPLHFECQNAVPPTRGMGESRPETCFESAHHPQPHLRPEPSPNLGSSSAALVSGLAAGLALGGKDLSTPATKKLLLQLAADEEGHPDNGAPAASLPCPSFAPSPPALNQPPAAAPPSFQALRVQPLPCAYPYPPHPPLSPRVHAV